MDTLKEMYSDYQNTFKKLGYDVRNKEYEEVLTFLANELLKTQMELDSIRREMIWR